MVDDADGTHYSSEMTFSEVPAARTPDYGWTKQRSLGGTVTLTLTDLGDGRTELTNDSAGDCTPEIMAAMEQGTSDALDQLEELLSHLQF